MPLVWFSRTLHHILIPKFHETQLSAGLISVGHTVVSKDHQSGTLWYLRIIFRNVTVLAVLPKMECLLFQEWKCPFQKQQWWPLSYYIFRWDEQIQINDARLDARHSWPQKQLLCMFFFGGGQDTEIKSLRICIAVSILPMLFLKMETPCC